MSTSNPLLRRCLQALQHTIPVFKELEREVAAHLAAAPRPVARAHIRVSEDEITAELEVLDGTDLQPEMSPVPLYTEPHNLDYALALALVRDNSTPTQQGWYLVYHRRASDEPMPRVAYWHVLDREWRRPHSPQQVYARRDVHAWYGPLPTVNNS